MKPDYRRIAELERAIYGVPLSHPAVTFSPPRGENVTPEVDTVLRDAARWFTGRTVPDFEGSQFARTARTAVWLLLGFAGVWLCLVVTGVVHA